MVLRSNSYVAQRPNGEVVLVRRVVARYGAGRIVITVRKASLQGETQPAQIGDVVVFGRVSGYLVGITVRNAGLPAALCARRATALAGDPRLLIWPHGVEP